MSQPRERYVRKCNASTSITSVKIDAESITTETPPIEQPPGVQNMISDQSEEEDEFWPLSGKPHFDVVIKKTHLSGFYQMLMPSRMQKELPCATDVPVVVSYRGKKWEMVYTSTQADRRLQRAGWKQFAVDNHLKIGDACVFELVDCSSDRIEFKAQILRGDFPAELLERIDGLTKENPLTVH